MDKSKKITMQNTNRNWINKNDNRTMRTMMEKQQQSTQNNQNYQMPQMQQQMIELRNVYAKTMKENQLLKKLKTKLECCKSVKLMTLCKPRTNKNHNSVCFFRT